MSGAPNCYFVHDGYIGWSYGTPGDPQLVSSEDAEELMRRTGLTLPRVSADFPPAQFAEKESPLSRLFGGTRFLAYGDISKCGDKRERKINTPLKVDWKDL
jgi:hypothetical protein